MFREVSDSAVLVDRSLVVYESDADRYRLLETVRHIARERLLAHGVAEAVRDAHADHYIGLFTSGAAFRGGGFSPTAGLMDTMRGATLLSASVSVTAGSQSSIFRTRASSRCCRPVDAT